MITEVSISNGEIESGAAVLFGPSLVGIFIPTAFTGTSISFKASSDGNTYVPMHDGSGALYTRTIVQGTYVPLDPSLFVGIDYVKVVSNAAEAAARTLKLISLGLA